MMERMQGRAATNLGETEEEDGGRAERRTHAGAVAQWLDDSIERLEGGEADGSADRGLDGG